MNGTLDQSLRWGMVPLRFAVGLVFMMHGAQKIFVTGYPGVAGFFGHLGIPLPHVAAAVVMTVELLGGLAVLTGTLTRWAAAALAIDMTVVIMKVKLHAGLMGPRGFELEFTLLCAALTLVLLGPGGLSVEGLLRRRRNR
jgi:putative oxidoreductase